MTKKILIIAAIIVVAIIAITFFIFSFTYSEGSRAGLLIKFSKKGYVFKTYEGELNLAGINGAAPLPTANTMWAFSVKDENVAYKLMSLEGQYINVHYHQIMKSLPWQGDTEYFVDGVEKVTR